MFLFDSEEKELLNEISFKAIILMGGEGQRLKRSTPKQFLPLGGKKVYQWALDTFLEIPFFNEVILVCHPEYMEELSRDLIRYEDKVSSLAAGKTRSESSYLGLQACGNKTDFVLIHDAVRPFVTVDVIIRNLREVVKSGACDTCTPVNDTIVCADEGLIESIPDRNKIYQGQTPQSFRYDWIIGAHQAKDKSKDFSDDCQLLLQSGKKISLVSGSEENHKITTPWDWEIAQWYAEKNLSFAHQ